MSIFLHKGQSLLIGVSYAQRPSPVVLQLFQREDVLIEIFLEFFVGVVDVKLFKPVHLREEGEKKICSAASKRKKKLKAE